MSRVQALSITPRDIHALWLLLRATREVTEEYLCSIAQRTFRDVDERDISRLGEIGGYIGLLELRGGHHLPTPAGREFGSLSHWRLWDPPMSAQATLVEQGIEYFFINPEEHQNRPIIIDLFAGVGGLSLGFAAAGFHVALAIDNDPHACEAHRLNFPETIVVEDDVASFADNPREYLAQFPELAQRPIAGIIGGPPCQGFSVIGERSTSDERNLLTTRFMDSVLALEPDFFVMENVPGLQTTGIAPTFRTYLRRLASSNGEPASVLIDMLPLPAKLVTRRARQFKKRVISSTIRKFRVRADEYFRMNAVASLEPELAITYLHNDLKTLFSAEILQVYANQNIAADLIAKGEKEIAAITVANACERQFNHQAHTNKEWRDYFESLALFFPEDSIFRRIIGMILGQYDAFPPSKVYRGKKVGTVLSHILERAEEAYDIATPVVLNAASYGTPQDRERLFLVGIKKTLGLQFTFPEVTHHLIQSECQKTPDINFAPSVREALSDLPDVDTMPSLLDGDEFSSRELVDCASPFGSRMRLQVLDKDDLSLPRSTWDPYSVDCSNRTTHEDNVRRRLENLEPGKQDSISRKRRLHPEQLAPTLRAGTKPNKGSHTAVRPVHYAYHRVISVREGARLMGYPDWMTFHPTKWHGFRLVGNGVPFPLANAIARQIKKLCYDMA